jgi:hypothetical protein
MASKIYFKKSYKYVSTLTISLMPFRVEAAACTASLPGRVKSYSYCAPCGCAPGQKIIRRRRKPAVTDRVNMKKDDKGITNLIWRFLEIIVRTEVITILALIIIFSVYLLPIKFAFRTILAIIIFILYVFLLFRKTNKP